MKRLFYIIFILFAGCSALTDEQPFIHIKGSTTMQPLVEKLATEYMLKHPGISIYVEGGTTTAGINSLLNGEIDVAAASRELKPQESKLLAEYYGTVGMYYLVAKDALTIYVNKSNPVTNLKINQVGKIFSGEINNWSYLGGNDEEIVVASRLPNSGTYYHLHEFVLRDKPFTPDAKIFHSVGDVIKFVNKNSNAIGYGGMQDTVGVKHVSIENVYPNVKNSRNDSYPFTRYLFFFTTNTARGHIKKFADWVLSAEGQKVINNAGFISLWDPLSR